MNGEVSDREKTMRNRHKQDKTRGIIYIKQRDHDPLVNELVDDPIC
jgi:hypothetical protein